MLNKYLRNTCEYKSLSVYYKSLRSAFYLVTLRKNKAKLHSQSKDYELILGSIKASSVKAAGRALCFFQWAAAFLISVAKDHVCSSVSDYIMYTAAAAMSNSKLFTTFLQLRLLPLTSLTPCAMCFVQSSFIILATPLGKELLSTPLYRWAKLPGQWVVNSGFQPGSLSPEPVWSWLPKSISYIYCCRNMRSGWNLQPHLRSKSNCCLFGWPKQDR